ncbi:unnamed protein product, partial [Rotaria sp. Silwood2]
MLRNEIHSRPRF